MTRKIQNLTHRIVSIRGNSGQTWHLPPTDSLDLMDVEVTDNAKIAKLVANGIVAVQHEESVQPVSTPQERGRRSRAQQEEGA
jgi:hypothetical protein